MANKWIITKETGDLSETLSIFDEYGQVVFLSVDPTEQQIMEAKVKGNVFIRKASLRKFHSVKDYRDVGLAIIPGNELILYGKENEIISKTKIEGCEILLKPSEYKIGDFYLRVAQFVDDYDFYRHIEFKYNDDFQALKRVLRREGAKITEVEMKTN